MKELIFEVIPDEQTPITPKISDVNKFIKEHEEEISEFYNYAITRANCAGLAANQCSLNGERFNLRMAAIKIFDNQEFIIAIDPKITKYYGMVRKKAEGCLTWKNKTIVAERNMFVDVEYYTIGGELVKETHKGFQGQVWQHEVNHINGVVEEVHGDVDFRDGVTQLVSESIGRNEPCPCGSGKKYKKCCIE